MPIMTNYVDTRWLRCILLGVTVLGTSVEAQASRRAPKEIAQIVDAALHAVIPPEKALTQFTVAERGVRLDFSRIMAAFGYDVDDATARSTLKLRSAASPGTRALLSDCSQTGMKPCKQLGKAAYVDFEFVSATDSEAVVWVHVNWVTTSPKRAYLSGFSWEVYLSRGSAGSWKFDRVDKRVIY